MADPKEPSAFLSVLPPAFSLARIPVAYRVLRSTDLSDTPSIRHVNSEPYRTTGYACQPFHRPMSKLLRIG